MAERSTATVRILCEAMEHIAPTWAAAEWDNVGLLVGDPARPVRRVLLAIDLTAAVLSEARRGRFEAVVAYHPPLFRPVTRFVVGTLDQHSVAAEAAASGMAVYSPHTALDAAAGGPNDTLAALAGLKDAVPFEAAASGPDKCKLVVFVPPERVDAIAEAVFDAGAGRIGQYEKCSFRLAGQGTFFGTESTAPAVGRRGRFERVDEIRLEVILPRIRLPDVTAAVRRAHPYDEPAFDVYPLQRLPDGRIGQGRIGRFARRKTLAALARSMKQKTGAANVVTVGGPARSLCRGLVCVGAAGSLPFDMPATPCGPGDVVITGEIRHHDALCYRRSGVAAIALGHWASERPVLKPLARRLAAMLNRVTVVVSRSDRDPFGSV
ncbi:MAG: Nif3-like dinuclear metal center hexameric protein [Phycisphaerae bacterium]